MHARRRTLPRTRPGGKEGAAAGRPAAPTAATAATAAAVVRSPPHRHRHRLLSAAPAGADPLLGRRPPGSMDAAL